MAIIRPTGYLSHYGFSPEETEEYIAHYGVKGMKWRKHLKAKITDLSDQYITGKSAREQMMAHQRAADMYAQNASNARTAADDRSRRALEDREDVRSYSRAIGTSNRSSGSFPIKGGTARVNYSNLQATGRGKLAGMGIEAAKSAKSNTASSHMLRNRQRAAENKYHEENAKAVSAKRKYERSIAGKLYKLKKRLTGG